MADDAAPRDKLYWATATMMVMDSYSTWRALESSPDVIETNYFMNEMYGPRPNGRQLLEFTIMQFALLEWTRTWNKSNRRAFQYAISITKGMAVVNNFSIAFD